jgi:hypothetical protein
MVSRLISHNKKALLGKIAWLKSPVRHRTLAPFGGITRIRFKGSSNLDLSAIAAPPHFFLVQNKTLQCEVNAHAAHFGKTANIFGKSVWTQSDRWRKFIRPPLAV